MVRVHKPRTKEPRELVDWTKDTILLTIRELVAILKEYKDFTPPMATGLISSLDERLKQVSMALHGREWTIEQIREHVRTTQISKKTGLGKEFTDNALLMRANHLKYYDEYSPYREYVLGAYLQIVKPHVNVPIEFEQWMIDKRLKECGNRCEYRGCTLVRFEADHFIPKKRGGRGNYDNLRIACWKCNNEKRAMDPQEFIAKIQREQSRGRRLK